MVDPPLVPGEAGGRRAVPDTAAPRRARPMPDDDLEPPLVRVTAEGELAGGPPSNYAHRLMVLVVRP